MAKRQTYGFTCGYCEATLDTPHTGATKATQFAHRAGWRMTYGPSPRWGDGANNTCPDCIPITEDQSSIIPMSPMP